CADAGRADLPGSKVGPSACIGPEYNEAAEKRCRVRCGGAQVPPGGYPRVTGRGRNSAARRRRSLAMAVTIRLVRRAMAGSGRSVDVLLRALDQRPPLVDFGREMFAGVFGRRLVERHGIGAQIVETRLDRRVGERI